MCCAVAVCGLYWSFTLVAVKLLIEHQQQHSLSCYTTASILMSRSSANLSCIAPFGFQSLSLFAKL